VEVKEKERKGESMGKTGKEKNIARGGRLRAAHGGGEERRGEEVGWWRWRKSFPSTSVIGLEAHR